MKQDSLSFITITVFSAVASVFSCAFAAFYHTVIYASMLCKYSQHNRIPTLPEAS